MEQEALVVMEDTTVARTGVDDLRRAGQVTQVLPPRLALVVPGPVDPAAAAGLSVHTDDRPDLVDATEAERLFVEAWWSRRADKRRPGDGLPWDAPGFQAPG